MVMHSMFDYNAYMRLTYPGYAQTYLCHGHVYHTVGPGTKGPGPGPGTKGPGPGPGPTRMPEGSYKYFADL